MSTKPVVPLQATPALPTTPKLAVGIDLPILTTINLFLQVSLIILQNTPPHVLAESSERWWLWFQKLARITDPLVDKALADIAAWQAAHLNLK